MGNCSCKYIFLKVMLETASIFFPPKAVGSNCVQRRDYVKGGEGVRLIVRAREHSGVCPKQW